MPKKNEKNNVQAKNVELKAATAKVKAARKAMVELGMDKDAIRQALLVSSFVQGRKAAKVKAAKAANIAAMKEKAKAARKAKAAMAELGMDKDAIHAALLASMPTKAKEKETSHKRNFHSFVGFMDHLSHWHKEKYKKPCPSSWFNAEKENNLSNGTQAVIHLLFLACKGDEQAKKLFTNQTDLNNKVRQLTGSTKYSNPNSAKVFGNFLKTLG